MIMTHDDEKDGRLCIQIVSTLVQTKAGLKQPTPTDDPSLLTAWKSQNLFKMMMMMINIMMIDDEDNENKNKDDCVHNSEDYSNYTPLTAKKAQILMMLK